MLKEECEIHPKEKAIELTNKFTHFAYTNLFSFRNESNWSNAKKCAIIAIDEIISITKSQYWIDVKEEVIKLELPSA